MNTEKAPAAVGTYSQGVEFNGISFFSGQIGICLESNELADGFVAQLDQVLKNIDGLLEAQSLTRNDIIKTSIFVTDLAHFGHVNEAYTQYFEAPYPARSAFAVRDLPKGALVEIEMIAVK